LVTAKRTDTSPRRSAANVTENLNRDSSRLAQRESAHAKIEKRRG